MTGRGSRLPLDIAGVVAEGRKLGRLLGFPTANIALAETDPPAMGVYATVSRLQDGRAFAGVANVGVNPTTGVVAPRLEVHLFDFDENLYGQTLTTRLIAFLRPEARFDDLPRMIAQMREDAAQAREILVRSGFPGAGLTPAGGDVSATASRPTKADLRRQT